MASPQREQERIRSARPDDVRIAVLIPCYNEEAAIGPVVQAFRSALPSAHVYVYDNDSNDRTATVARASGAIVRSEPLRGKGNVLRRMFADIDADVYLTVDGDGTYEPGTAAAMISKLLNEQLDMVCSVRTADWTQYRRGHRFGNVALTWVVATIFGRRTTDMLSGYRVMSRRFAKTFPALSSGFEIETELTVHALEMRMPIGEIESPYQDRALGSASKLSTFRDGLGILWLIAMLYKDERPLRFFGTLAIVLLLLSAYLAIPVLLTYLETGLVPRLPTALLSTGLVIISFLLLTCGLILETVTRARRELKRLAYLAHPTPPTFAYRSSGSTHL